MILSALLGYAVYFSSAFALAALFAAVKWVASQLTDDGCGTDCLHCELARLEAMERHPMNGTARRRDV